jgi:hypothetical protein
MACMLNASDDVTESPSAVEEYKIEMIQTVKA